MGLFVSKAYHGQEVVERPDRAVFIRNPRCIQGSANIKSLTLFGVNIHYQRYVLSIDRPFYEYLKLETILRKNYPVYMMNVQALPRAKSCACTSYSNEVLLRYVVVFIQSILDEIELIQSDEVSSFVGIGPQTFQPELGQHGKDGYLYKSSGGYAKRFSNRPGDYIPIFSNRYFVFRSNQILWYDSKDLNQLKGVMLVDINFHVTTNSLGNKFTISNKTRSLSLFAKRSKEAVEWSIFFRDFYGIGKVPRRLVSPHFSTFPERINTDVKVYSISKNYFAAVAKAILSAQREIFITSWKNSPSLYLTRPPHPPVRLDQLLKYKADLGVKIYILLYKEVELVGQGNNSQKSMEHLTKLSSNIQCIRHPNKLIGGSTAVLWSHHEKLVIVDRNLAFVGGIDLAYNRWDNELHSCIDEDGLVYPGPDYRQPGIGKFKPAIEELGPTQINSESFLAKDETPSAPPLPEIADTAPRRSTFSDQINFMAEMAKNQISEQVNTWTESAKSQINKYIINPYIEKAKLEALMKKYPLRELYPRTAWHDVHACVAGLPARDIAAHFIQRWNHHRLSCGLPNIAILNDVTDELNFGICARCETRNISESYVLCPTCFFDLGRSSYFLNSPSSDLLPPKPDTFACLTFECVFMESTGCMFIGDGPSVVSEIVEYMEPESSQLLSDDLKTRTEGDNGNIKELPDESLKKEAQDDVADNTAREEIYVPRVGDVLVAINDNLVTHLNHSEVSRLVQRIKKYVGGPIRFHFRRHISSQEDQIQALATPGLQLVEAVSFEPSAPMMEMDDDYGYASSIPETDQKSSPAANETEYAEAVLVENTSINPILEVNDVTLLDESPASHRRVSVATENILKISMSKEILLSMAKLHEENIADAALPGLTGSCHVQVLRSVGPWSIGIDVETSIMNAYTLAISKAERFIYIENQFFISSLAGADVKNPIASMLVQRIMRAIDQKEKFKVIVIMPQHPSGDIAQSPKPRIILNYEHLTIDKGKSSIIEVLKARLPKDVPYSQYIEFFCLRSRGVLQNKFYSDQIYVHDKVMIVDDRIAIIGSANINDRSMLGDRDSEVAIRFEDSNKLVIPMDMLPFEVGKSVHELRMRLMSQHVACTESEQDMLVDVLNGPRFHNVWNEVAERNTYVYDCLDGITSVYQCKSLQEYKNNLPLYRNPDITDPSNLELIRRLQGFLVYWPMEFLAKEDHSPPMAVRALVPNQLWV